MSISFEFGSSHSWLFSAVIAVLGTAFGALTGSWFSFYFERHSRKQEIKELNLTAVNLSLTLLFNNWYSLFTYKINALESAERKILPWLEGIATYPRSNDEVIKFDPRSLGFLSLHNHDILPRLLMIQSNNIVVFNLLARRFTLIDEISRLQKPNTLGERDENYWRVAIGDARVIELKQLYSHIWDSVEQTLKDTRDAFRILHDLIIHIYPHSREAILNSDFDERAVRLKVTDQ